jgi:hypothetical protein
MDGPRDPGPDSRRGNARPAGTPLADRGLRIPETGHFSVSASSSGRRATARARARRAPARRPGGRAPGRAAGSASRPLPCGPDAAAGLRRHGVVALRLRDHPPGAARAGGQPYPGRRRGGRTLLHRDGRGGRGAGPRRDGRALRDRSRGSPDPAARPRDAGKIRDAGGVGRKGHQPVLGSVPRPGRDGSAQLAHAVSPRVLPHASRPALRLAVPAPSLRTRPTSSPTSSARRPTAVARRSFSSRDASRRTRPPSPTWTAPITAAGRSSAWTPGKPRSRSSR